MRHWFLAALFALPLGTPACAPCQPAEEGGLAGSPADSEQVDVPDPHAGPDVESTPAAGPRTDPNDEEGWFEAEFGPEVAEEHKAVVKERFIAKMKERLAAKMKESGETGRVRMTMNSVFAGEPDDSGWYLAHTPRGRFSVRTPIAFSDYTISTVDKDGVSTQSNSIMAVDHRGVRFAAFASRRSDGKPESKNLGDVAGSLQGKKEVRPIKVDGMEGIEIRVEGPGSSALVRVFRSDTTSFMLIAEGFRPLGLADFEEEGWRFLRSFRLDRASSDSETPEGGISPTDPRDDAH
jgi:hypothetical protein